jgi:two-component system phosphate regulon sensor histidine kinase PhoR
VAAVLVIVCVLLAAVCAGLAVLVGRLRRERAVVFAEVGSAGGAHDDLSSAVRRALARRAPREELLAVVSTRDAILGASPVPILVFADDGVVVRANRAARRTFDGVGPGTTAAAIGSTLDEAVRRVATTAEPVDDELVLDRPDRRTFEAHLRSHVDGARRGVVAVLVDVTASVDFREARRLFSAAVSHELRTPLARILGLAETLVLPQSEAERDALLAQTENEIDNMRRLVDEMLLLASLDRGAAAVAEGVSDAGRIAEDVVADRRSRRAQRNRELSIEVGQGLAVGVAPRLLEVVIGNLVDNALRHAGGDASVGVSVHGGEGEVEIVVHDSGVGIPPEHLPHVFERFYRGEASRSGPGSGLGLAIVKHVVEAHDGEVAVDSRPGCGTTVRLVLPQVAVGRR